MPDESKTGTSSVSSDSEQPLGLPSGASPQAKKKKVKRKKKAKPKPVIPTHLAANIGEKRRAEMQSEPEEVFESVKPKPKEEKKEKEKEVKILPLAAASSSSSSSSYEMSRPTVTLRDVNSLPKGPIKPPKVHHQASKDKVIDYKIDVERTFSQSSGTLSYDSVIVPDATKMNHYKATGIKVRVVEPSLVTSKSVDLVGALKLAEARPFDLEEYKKQVRAEKCPVDAQPTPEYICGRREQQLAAECVSVAVEEYFAADREDMDLLVRIQRRGLFPIVSVQVVPNPRTLGDGAVLDEDDSPVHSVASGHSVVAQCLDE